MKGRKEGLGNAGLVRDRGPAEPKASTKKPLLARLAAPQGWCGVLFMLRARLAPDNTRAPWARKARSAVADGRSAPHATPFVVAQGAVRPRAGEQRNRQRPRRNILRNIAPNGHPNNPNRTIYKQTSSTPTAHPERHGTRPHRNAPTRGTAHTATQHGLKKAPFGDRLH